MAEKMVRHEPGGGRAYWMLGGLYTVKAGADETGGAMTVIEFTVREGMGPPPHTHDCSETVYVLEGRMRFHLDGEVMEAGPGSFVHIPAGVWEQPEPMETPTRFLSVYQPGGFEEFFAEVGEPAATNTLPPVPEGPPDVARIAEVGARYGLQVRAPEG